MQYIEEFLESTDGHEIPVRAWRPREVKQTLVIAHGISEYCERYASMAEYLTEQNIAVVALNHRGHGMDCPDEDLGHFADSHGWQNVLDDLDTVIQFTKNEFKKIPITLMGHSMGSFIAQCYIQQHPNAVDNLILTSTNKMNPVKLKSDLLAVSLIRMIQGPKSISKIIGRMSFLSFNSHFKPNRTKFDWLSRDTEHVDAYINDPYCGFLCTNQLWQDFLAGMASINVKKWPSDLPIHLLSGTADPLGKRGKGVNKLKDAIVKAKLKLTTFKLYPEARHELTNETNALEVWQDIGNIVLSTAKK